MKEPIFSLSMGKAGFFILLLFLFFSGFSFFCCKSNSGPDDKPKPIQYRTAEVTYERDPAKVINPAADEAEAGTGIYYELYDPELKINEKKSSNDILLEPPMRYGYVPLQKISDYKFKATIEQVFVQTESGHPKHHVYVRDLKLYDGATFLTVYTAAKVAVANAYDTEIVNYKLYFKMQ